ncbi:MAG: type II secretion system protein M [Deltaproteobacteria bacterium]|nr:type II secretion system protein M [Deltaproteobacteria bacterium]
MREGRIQSWFARLSDRERTIVIGGGLLVGAVVLVLVGLLVSRKVATMEEAVADNADALTEIRELAPEYLRARREEKAIDESLTRAQGTSLQSLLLDVAKDIQFERKFSDEGGGVARLADFIKFSNANEVLADLTTRKDRRRSTSSKKKKKKVGKQVFVASIEVVFDRIPDTALFQFLERVDTHEGGLFATSLDISRDSPNREHFRAKMTIAQFRYGAGEEGS